MELRTFVADYAGHKSHLQKLEELFGKLRVQCQSLRIGDSQQLKYLLLRQQCDYILATVAELNEAILGCLSAELYSSVESLARVSVEHSINLLYIIHGEEHERSKSILKHHIVGSRARAEKWRDYARREGDEKAEWYAERKLSHLDEVAYLNPHLLNRDVKGWPDARARFKDVGFENLYHVVFAPASDSVHALSEDMFNLRIIENYPPALRADGFEAFLAEKASFAYYLATNALGVFAIAVVRMAERLRDNVVLDDARLLQDEIGVLIADHERLLAVYSHE